MRAAGTLIRHFYLRGAQSYQDLEKRLPHLIKAQKHLEKLIKHSETNLSCDTEKYNRYRLFIKIVIDLYFTLKSSFIKDVLKIASI